MAITMPHHSHHHRPAHHRGHSTTNMKHQLDPYEDSRYPLFRFRGSVITRVQLPMLVMLAYTVAIVCVNELTPIKLGISSVLTTIMSVVTGLILVFRTNTAYDRYWEGRRLWGQVHAAIRTSARIIWVHAKEPNAESVILKKSAMNLLAAFAISTKHYLRREYAINYDDLFPLIRHIPKFSTPAANIDYDNEQTPSALREHRLSNAFPRFATPTNLPLEITLYLGSYFSSLRNEDHLDIPTFTLCINQMALLTDTLCSFERILRSPIPLAYGIHLSHTVWLYLLVLPFQLVGLYGWVSILISIVVSFTFLGVEAIGAEIENPFGYDYNDLPLDDFCHVIVHELNAITSQPPLSIKEWAISSDNHPFTNNPNVSAAELIRNRVSIDDVRSLLSNNDAMEGRPSVEKKPSNNSGLVRGSSEGTLSVVSNRHSLGRPLEGWTNEKKKQEDIQEDKHEDKHEDNENDVHDEGVNDPNAVRITIDKAS